MANLHPPADGSLARDDVTLAVVEAEVSPQLADALTGQTVHAEVACVADALRLPRPLVDLTLCILVTGLEFTGVRLVAWKEKHLLLQAPGIYQRDLTTVLLSMASKTIINVCKSVATVK